MSEVIGDIDSAVLVVVDMQNRFVNSHSRHIVPVIKRLVQRWQSVNGQVVFTRFINEQASPYERLLGWRAMKTSPDIDLVSELMPLVHDVIEKPTYTMFTPEGSHLVNERGWTSLIFCGVATDSCILKSAIDAFERDLTPIVIEDACASHGGEHCHNSGLQVIAEISVRSKS